LIEEAKSIASDAANSSDSAKTVADEAKKVLIDAEGSHKQQRKFVVKRHGIFQGLEDWFRQKVII
jgi:hypothetical protein